MATMKNTTRLSKAVGFLASTAWAKIKVDLYTLRGKRCESCGGTRSIQVHHLNYDRYGGGEEPEDLILLCGNCHMIEHGLRKLKKTNNKKKKKIKLKRRNQEVTPQKKLSMDEIIAKSLAMDIKHS
jgi:5-methylcytosine-specific restriction endonuclease McrA